MPGAPSRNRAARSRCSSLPRGWKPLRLPYPVRISTAPWRTDWRSASRRETHRRSACSRSPRRSAVPIGSPRALVLRNSNKLAGLEAVAQCWFEDDPQVAQAVDRASGRDRAKLATYLLQSVIARRRDRWAEIILRTALWMREAPESADLCWPELAIVAKALAVGRDMTEIGLMRDIASRTIA